MPFQIGLNSFDTIYFNDTLFQESWLTFDTILFWGWIIELLCQFYPIVSFNNCLNNFKQKEMVLMRWHWLRILLFQFFGLSSIIMDSSPQQDGEGIILSVLGESKYSGFRQIGVGGLKFSQRLGNKGQSLLKFVSLVQINPSRPKPRRREKNKLNFYFRTSLWCLKRFYQGL